MSTSPQGCTRHLGISALMLLLLGAGMVIWNWDTFSMIFSNMKSMGQGATAANRIASPDDLLTFLAEHDGASLVAFDVGAEAEGIYYRADVVRPVVNLPRLLLLAAYAAQAERGKLTLDARIPLDSITSLHLPGVGHQGHPTALKALRAEGRIVEDSLALRNVLAAMIQWNDPAAADYLLLRQGLAALERLPERLAVPSLGPPLPAVGRFLMWDNHTMATPPDERLPRIMAMSERARAGRAFTLADTLRADTLFRRQEVERLRARGTALTLDQQRKLAATTFPDGTARGYAEILGRLASSAPPSLPGDSVMRAFVERLADTDSLDTPFERLATESGAFPGLISFAGYARRDGEPTPRVMVLLLEDVPMAVFYHLLQTGIDRGFQLQMMADNAFFEQVRTRLMDSGGTASRRGSS